jgi:hypothetical protein
MMLTPVIRALGGINDVIREYQQSLRLSKIVRAEADAHLLQSLKETFNDAIKHFSVCYPAEPQPI